MTAFFAATCQPLRGSLGFADSRITFVAARSATTEHDEAGGVDFQALVDVHYAPLYRFALSLARTEHDAADLVQETFLTWATKGHQLLDRSKAKSWLFTTLHRRFLEGQRRITRFPQVELAGADAELPVVESELIDKLDAKSAVELLGQVDALFRAAVALFYLEDYSYQEIASILEVPLGTVKSRIARGLGQLKQLVLAHTSSSSSAGGKAS